VLFYFIKSNGIRVLPT